MDRIGGAELCRHYRRDFIHRGMNERTEYERAKAAYIEAVKRDLRPLIKARRYREASAVIREHPDIIDELRTYIITTK